MQLIAALLRKRFMRSVLTVASGTAGAQALTLAVAPVLTRIYGPEAFGALGTFSVIVATVGVIACLRLDLAIVVPEDDADALEVVQAALLTALAVATMTGLVLLFVLQTTLTIDPSVARLLWLVPIGVAGLGAFQVGTQWLARTGRFDVIARAHLLRSVMANGLPLLAIPLGLGALALALGTVGGQVASATSTLLTGLKRRFGLKSQVSAIWAATRESYSRYARFALYGTPQALLNAVNQAMPVAVLGIGFDVETIGYYVLARRFLKAPVTLAGQATRQVLYPRLARAINEGEGTRLARLMTLGMAIVALIPLGIVAAFGPALFTFLLGDAWRTAGVFASLSAFWVAVTFANVPAVSLIPLLGMQRGHAVFEVVYILSRLAALVAGVYVSSAEVSIGASAAVGVIFNVALILFVLAKVHQHERSIA